MRESTAARRLFDVGLPLVLAAAGVAEIWVPFSSVMGSGSRTLSTVVAVLASVLLVFRRRWPLPVAVAVLWLWPAVFSVQTVLVLFWGQFVPIAIAIFSVARYGRGREPWLGAVAGAATLLFFDLRVEALQSPSEIFFHWMVVTIAWSFGWGLHVLEDRARASTEHAVAVEVAAAEQAMRAVLDERTRIARELHDVIAHSVSVMVVQAGAAELVVEDDPGFARQALSTIRSTGTDALAEMRRAVAMLREEDEAGALAPQPGVEALPALVEEARLGGLDASLRVEGDPVRLSPGLDLAAYRIVQEALTNVRRHAGASTALVALHYAEKEVSLEVLDDGVGMNGQPSGGHGLVGMRERVALYGGELETTSPAGGGFTVRARLPLVAE